MDDNSKDQIGHLLQKLDKWPNVSEHQRWKKMKDGILSRQPS